MSSSTLQICTAVLVSVTLPQTLTNAWESMERNAKDRYKLSGCKLSGYKLSGTPRHSEPLKCGHLNSTDVLLRYGLHSYKQPYIITSELRIPGYSVQMTGFFGPLDCCHGNMSRHSSVAASSSFPSQKKSDQKTFLTAIQLSSSVYKTLKLENQLNTATRGRGGGNNTGMERSQS